jgi:hypothetical protein
MVSTFTPNKLIEKPAFNDYIDTWDVPVNNNWSIIDLALGGTSTINTTGLSGTIALTSAQYKPLTIRFTGTPAAAITYSVPSGVGGQWVIRNDATIAVGLVSAAGGATVSVPAATNTLVTCDGTALGMRQSVAVPPSAAGPTTSIQFNTGGLLSGSTNMFWDGTFIWSTGIVSLGNSVLGLNVGNYVTINAGSIDIPNNTVIGAGTLLALQASTGQIGIGLAPSAGDKLTVGGRVHTTAGGYMFPDGTIQTTAAAPGGTPGGVNQSVQYNNSSTFGGTSTFIYNSVSQILQNTHLIITGNCGFNTAGFSGNVSMSGTLNVTGAIASAANISAATMNTTGNVTVGGALGAGSLSLSTPLPVASGGTAGNTQAAAANGLAVLARAGGGVSSTNFMSGDILMGQNSTLTPGSSNNTVGSNLAANGSLHLSHAGAYVQLINRTAGDGDCIVFSRLSTAIGTISLTAAQVFYNITSDERVKTIVGPVPHSMLGQLDKVNVYWGYYNAEPDKLQPLVLAHEFAEAAPEAVTGERGGEKMQQVSWSTAVPWLIGVIKELRAEVEALKRAR